MLLTVAFYVRLTYSVVSKKRAGLGKMRVRQSRHVPDVWWPGPISKQYPHSL